ncbi:MAG: SDR family oxidoreductase, partial [Aeromicrobium sp.]
MTTDLSTDFSDAAGAALVVGGSGGLGAEIARMLAARGSDVAVTYRSNKEAGDAVASEVAELGVRSSAHALDVTSADNCASVLADVATTYGGVHTLIYASGPHVPMVHLSRVSPADFAEQLTQDAVGFFNLAHPALPFLRETKGSIVAVTTAATARFPVRDGLSSAPKGAVEQTVRGLAAEEGRFGIRVNAVGPGMLTDGMAARLIESGELDD